MKKILITGANSYIGTSFEHWIQQWPEQYQVETINMKDSSWIRKDFSEYEVIFHVAGIAHVSSSPKLKELYYKVNRDLTIETAMKAKKDGVKQFIFMSSIIVYGDSSPINQKRIIDKNTMPKPSNFYGDSKIQAEEGILPLMDASFNIVVLRPPMIYGKNSKGNYPKLSKIAKKLPIFPDINNCRSMIYIDNLCEFIRAIINNNDKGIFYPQNKEYVKTSELVKLIANVNGKKVRLVEFFNPIIKVMSMKFVIFDKMFGNLAYDMDLSSYKDDYQIKGLYESILETEKEKSL